jgi:hypothetical protein
MQNLSMAVSDSLTLSFVELELRLPISDGKTIAWLATHAEVLSKHYQDDLCLVHCRMSIGAAGKLAGQGTDMRVLKGKLPEPAKRGLPNTATYVPTDPTDTDPNSLNDDAKAASSDFAIETIDLGTLPAEPTAQPKVG